MASSSTADFIFRLRKFVQDEAETQREALMRQWARSLHERVAKGWAVEGLRVDKFKNNIARLVCATNDSRFREGDLVVLHRGNPHDENAQHCELQYDGENELEVSLIHGNEYFLLNNPMAGFWKPLGLQARGRTHNLLHSYRTTREILQFATLLYRLRLADEKDGDILVPDLLNMPTGAFPEIIPLTSPQDEIIRFANEVASLVKQGVPKKDLLLIHMDGYGVKSLIQAIDDRLGKNAALDAKDNYPGDYIRVTTLNAGAGLESAIVFLAGLRQLFEEEQSLRLSDDEREMLIRDNTKKLYMAVTRAGQRLVLTYTGELPEVLKSALGG